MYEIALFAKFDPKILQFESIIWEKLSGEAKVISRVFSLMLICRGMPGFLTP